MDIQSSTAISSVRTWKLVTFSLVCGMCTVCHTLLVLPLGSLVSYVLWLFLPQHLLHYFVVSKIKQEVIKIDSPPKIIKFTKCIHSPCTYFWTRQIKTDTFSSLPVQSFNAPRKNVYINRPSKTPLLYSKTWVYRGIHYFFLFLLKNIDFGYSLEPPCLGGSNGYTQSMFWAEIWKISGFLCERFQFLEVKSSIYLNIRVFVMVLTV